MRVDWLQTTGMSSSSANAYRVANELSHGGQDFNPVGGWGSRVRVRRAADQSGRPSNRVPAPLSNSGDNLTEGRTTPSAVANAWNRSGAYAEGCGTTQGCAACTILSTSAGGNPAALRSLAS